MERGWPCSGLSHPTRKTTTRLCGPYPGVSQCACSLGPARLTLESQCACSQGLDRSCEPVHPGCREASAFRSLMPCLLGFVLCTGGSVRPGLSSRRNNPMQPKATGCHHLASCLEGDPWVGKALPRMQKGSGAPVPSAYFFHSVPSPRSDAPDLSWELRGEGKGARKVS